MDKLSYSLGATALIISLIVRLSVISKKGSFKSKAEAGEIPSFEQSLEKFILLLVMVGIFWIGSGVVIALLKARLDSSIGGMIVQILLLMSPIILLRIIIWIRGIRNPDEV
jgi:hypothetical protein